MFVGKTILVAGKGVVARMVAEGLRAAARPVRRVDGLDDLEALVRSARILILADALTDTRDLIGRLRDADRLRPRRRRPPLRVILPFVGSPPVSVEPPGDTPMRVEVLDLEHQAARIWLARWPLHAGMDPPFGQRVHVLIAGTAAPRRALALHAMRLAHYGAVPSAFTFAGPDPVGDRRALLSVLPQAERCCDLRFTRIDAPLLDERPVITSVYVCETPPEQGLETAHRLKHLITRRQAVSPPIHLEVGRCVPSGELSAWDGQIYPFSWLREACRPGILLDGREDHLARVIHDHYRDSIAAQGRDPAGEAGGQAWETLAASYRDANRHQADHVWAKLAATDCRAVPEERVESFAFAPLETERLAAIEHARWAADRYLDGWTYASVRDNVRKRHPQLISFDQLSAPMKDLDRYAVRLVPTLLARSGRGVVRMLIVGVETPGPRCRAGHVLARLARRAFERLDGRYPDRSLVVASTLAGAASRLVVRQGLEAHGAVLFLLCPRPLSETLDSQLDEAARVDLLDLAVRAERRIGLAAGQSVEGWFSQRADILVRLGAGTESLGPSKWVSLDPERGALDWNFEY
jgi:hypothetical protein